MEKGIKIKDGYVEIEINSRIYSKEIVFAAGYIFLDKAYILLDQDKDKIIAYIYTKDKNADLKKLGLDFYNELLNYAHYFSRTKANAEAIKSMMQRALFSSAPSLVQETEDKEIESLIKELEEEEKQEKHASSSRKSKK